MDKSNKKRQVKRTAIAHKSKNLTSANKKPPHHVPKTSEDESFFDFVSKNYQANLAKITAGISPAAVKTAFTSWLFQLQQSPGRLLELALFPMVYDNDYLKHILHVDYDDKHDDLRFQNENWKQIPWCLGVDAFRLIERWWQRATTDIPGFSYDLERMVSFGVRQALDAISPSNFVFTNPDLFNETIRTGGFNIIQGTTIAIEDALVKLAGAPLPGSEHFIPGKQVAITPGKVVFKNHLIELIQYEAQTKTTYKEPLLIIPAWIMKYYILDLSPHNSMVKWLVYRGHTVFMVSWRNPGKHDRNLNMDDYYRLGAMAAIDAVSAIFPATKINLMGYCIGGTLAMIAAASMARNGDTRLKSLTLLAAQADFTEAGEMLLFATKSEISFLKKLMWEQGYLDTKQMAGSFQMLRSYDLIWSKMLHDYMHGMRRGMIDLLAWNADATRMPYKMHSEYLEQLFLKNNFAEGRFTVEGNVVAPGNIQLPLFVVGTEKDHVAPWKSVYKVHLLTNNDITFVLTDGGHNAGILNVRDHHPRKYAILEQKKDSTYLDPDHWCAIAEKRKGLWWEAWHTWLVQQSSKKRVPAPVIKAPLYAAPGTYVMQK